MAKYKLSFKNLFTVVIAFFGSFVSTTVGAQANDVETADTPAPKAAGKDAKKEASGSLSAGAIAAAVAAAAALAAVIDSGDGGGAAPAPTPAPTETYEYSYYVPTMVNVNTNTNTSTSTNTLAAYAQFGVFLPNTNTKTNTNTNTTTQTLQRYVTNTNTTTVTNTNTSTSTNTNTNTTTSTYVSSGSDMSDYVVTGDPTDTLVDDYTITDLAIVDLIVDVEILDLEIGGSSMTDGSNLQTVGDNPLVVEIPIFREGYTDYATADAFYDLDEGALNLSVDDNYVTDLGSNITILEVLGNGYVNMQKDILLNLDQEFAQDLLYELEGLVIDDLVVEINQTYEAQVLKTETRTRLVGE